MRKSTFKPNIPFDPLHIILQITILQFIFYTCFVVFLLIFDFFFSIPFTQEQLFNYSVFSFSSKIGWSTILSFFLSFSSTGFAFSLIVGKMVKSLDFMTSTYLIHLIVVIFYSGFPTTLAWWIVSIASIAASVFIGIFASIQSEVINVDEAFLMH